MQLAPLPEPGPPTSRAAWLERLHGLIRAINGDLDLGRTLQSVCQGLVEGLGFDVALLNLVMPGGDLEVVAGAGTAEACDALLGTSAPREVWDDLMHVCQPVGELLVDYLHLAPQEDSVPTWVPDTPVPDDEDAWHPLDELFAPLWTTRSGLVGVISVDLPRDGRRPAPDQLVLLEMYAAQASVAIENAQLHTALLAKSEDRAEALGRLSTLVGSTPVAIVELDLDGVVRLWNPAAERIFGWSAAEVVGGLNPVAAEEEYGATLQRLDDAPLVREPARRRRRDVSPVDLEMSASVLRDEEGRPFGYLGVYADVTERIALERELRTAAYIDALTGLANRADFGERLERAAATGGATVLLLDLDGFKSVNDSAGHAAGDRVLVEVGRRIEATCRDGDLVARLGGDEFVVLLDGRTAVETATSDEAVEALAERLVNVLAQPIDVEPRVVRLGTSIGVARLRGAGTADDLLRDADVAMYAAKAQGKGRYRVFEPRLRSDLLEHADRIADLRSALERDELFVRWHPVVRVADQRLLGFESLVRWQHPVQGELPPAAFVALAEESGLVVELGRQVLHRSCATLRRWQDKVPGTAHTQISVNLSPVQLRGDIIATVREVLADTGVLPGHLLLELTEDVLLEDVQAAVEVLDGLRGLGVHLAIDDFGAGYSSLAYLKRLPVDVVKLDRSLLEEVETDRDALALFDAVVGLVARLGLTAVAEGVETAGQWGLLERLGCPVAQGFLLAEPLIEVDARRMLAVGRPSCGLRRAR